MTSYAADRGSLAFRPTHMPTKVTSKPSISKGNIGRELLSKTIGLLTLAMALLVPQFVAAKYFRIGMNVNSIDFRELRTFKGHFLTGSGGLARGQICRKDGPMVQ